VRGGDDGEVIIPGIWIRVYEKDVWGWDGVLGFTCHALPVTLLFLTRAELIAF
jgi:hypothetical protein